MLEGAVQSHLLLPERPRGEVEEQLQDLEGHGDGDAQVEAEGAAQSGKEPVQLQCDRVFKQMF